MSQNNAPSDKNENGGKKERYTLPFRPLSLAWEMGYTIAIPIVVFAVAGRLADNMLGTSPLLLLSGILLSMLVTSLLVYRKMIEVLRDIDEPANDTDEEDAGDTQKSD